MTTSSRTPLDAAIDVVAASSARSTPRLGDGDALQRVVGCAGAQADAGGSLTAVSSRYGAATTALTLADYELDADTGLLRLAAGGWFRGTYTVTYTSGRADLPAAIRLAVLVIAEHLWETQRGAAPVGPLSGDDTFPTPGLGFAIPNRALELLAPYRRPAVA
jgi:hypothetical protein